MNDCADTNMYNRTITTISDHTHYYTEDNRQYYEKIIKQLLEMWLETPITIYDISFTSKKETIISLAYSEELEGILNLLAMKNNLNIHMGRREITITLPLTNE